ncbi:MAG TPA: hypothetical protein VGQ07_00065 [Nitrospirales bacterium]|jgi:hypothetical protein|nr:hypothetical protein [Nitrospirales bacterium]
MSRNFWSRSIIVLALAGVLVSPVLAQERSRPGSPAPVPPVMEELDRMTEQERGPAGRGPADAEEGARHFQAKKRERLMQALQLDEATRNRLSQRLEQLDQRAEDLRRQRREAIEALRGHLQGLRKDMRRGPRIGGRGPEEAPPAAGTPGDNAALRQALERVYAMEEAMAGLRRERLQTVRDLLTPEQQVKFLLFNMRFQKEMRERLQREHGG